MSKFKFYTVGGCVRDEILGIKSKDIDYTVVYEDIKANPDNVFVELVEYLKIEGYETFLITPSCFTIRAMFPDDSPNKGIVADFVLSRKETSYIPSTRRPIVELGTLLDDLTRRDFTINAMARDQFNHLHDPFNGVQDLNLRILRTPLPVEVTFKDDPLRILRAIRFSITKNLTIPPTMWQVIYDFNYNKDFQVVSHERIREELYKCFNHNTIKTLNYLNKFPNLTEYCFKNNLLWLKPTMEK